MRRFFDRAWLAGAAALAVGAGAAAAEGGSGAATPADLVLVNGAIYTLDAARPWAEAAAIADGRYAAVGSSASVRAHIGPGTQVVDLGGAMAMPGLVDAHVHPTMGSGDRLFSCQFPSTATPGQIAALLPDCLREKTRAGWLTGGRWGSGFFDAHRIDSPRGWLDRFSREIAIVLEDDSGHNAWVNSKALELAGWTAKTPDPKGGRIVRDPATGEPTGLLLEEAAVTMRDRVPPLTAEQFQAAVRAAVEIANGFGIVAIKDAHATAEAGAAYAALDAAGALTLHTVACLSTPYGHREAPLDYAALEQRRQAHRGAHLRSDCVKIFLDGVPTPARTAAMLEPYLRDDGTRGTFAGDAHVPQRTLARDLIELDRRGFNVKIHAAGDRAVREALDAIAAARKANGTRGPHHEIAHAGFIAPQDIPRFRELGVVAELSPYLWHPSPIMESILRAVGPRAREYWPIRTLAEAGAPLAAGSDWPAVVPSMNPWPGIEAMVTRRDPYGEHPGEYWPGEAISLQRALQIFTVDGARALQLDGTGSVAVGKSADLIVLDRKLFEVPPGQIGDTQVRATYFRGRLVHAMQ